MKRIVCTVTTDLNYDQRMIRICSSLAKAGYDVTLVGRKRDFSNDLQTRNFKQKRLNGWFESGFFFYAEYNIRLFLHLWRERYDIINAVDLDSILPGYLVSRLRKTPIVYDAHEYFTEQEEIVKRPLIKRFWKWVEQVTVPRIKYGYTVSKGYADLFEREYNVHYQIVRNVTLLQKLPRVETSDIPFILYQGAVNKGRGLEVLVEAMQYIEGYKLCICGLGDIYESLIKQTQQMGLDKKIKFLGYVQPDELRSITAQASIGITLFANDGLSHQHSLANRFFDYMHAGVPQVAMKYPEYEQFNEEHEVACLLEKLDVNQVVEALQKLINDPAYYEHLRAQALKARQVHCWQQDEQTLLNVYETLEANEA
ncbi:MAG: glycosyltransferase family 4 protein [Leptolyngbya sp. SIO3F4]|nr:glycosyltransferase family 4 protein [Leptolyngbya sp. SIO3F4]